MGLVIALTSGKGGTGKTTVCAGVAACLAAEGYRVLCVDADMGLRNLDISLGLAELAPISFADVLAGLLADVTGKTFRIGASKQAPALGSAIFAAAAACLYPDVRSAAKAMGRVLDVVYHPIPEKQKRYDALYSEYAMLHDTFGRGVIDVLKRLRKHEE